MRFDIDVEVYACGYRLMMVVVPVMGMVMILVIILCFVTAGEGRQQEAGEEGHSKDVFNAFHDGCL